MNTKAWIYSILTYIALCVALIYLFDKFWPDNRVRTTVVPLVVGGLITHFIRKAYDFIFDYYNRNKVDAFLGVSVKINHSSRNFVGYGASCGEVIQAGNFKANYEVEADLTITIQNESPNTVYKVEVGYIPNSYSNRYTLVDSRENKLQSLEGNKHFDFTLRIKKEYYDMYVYDVDKDVQKLYKLGKDVSLLNGSKVIIKYLDSKHKARPQTEVIA